MIWSQRAAMRRENLQENLRRWLKASTFATRIFIARKLICCSARLADCAVLIAPELTDD